VSVEQMGRTTCGSSRGDADDEAHTAELEAALLAASSPGHEAHTDAKLVETGPLRRLLPRLRSEGLRFQ
jgi:hypothetical protein